MAGKLNAWIAGRQHAQFVLGGAGAGDDQAARGAAGAHGADDQVEALPGMQAADGEEVIRTGWIAGDERRGMAQDGGLDATPLDEAPRDGLANGKDVRDAFGAEAPVVHEVDQLARARMLVVARLVEIVVNAHAMRDVRNVDGVIEHEGGRFHADDGVVGGEVELAEIIIAAQDAVFGALIDGEADELRLMFAAEAGEEAFLQPVDPAIGQRDRNGIDDRDPHAPEGEARGVAGWRASM